MTTLTPFERSLQRTLMQRARNADPNEPRGACLSYTELGNEVDPDSSSHYPMTRPPFRGLNEALGHVVRYEIEHGRPLLTALVVAQDTGMPGPGFAGLARDLGFVVNDDAEFAQQELERVVDFWAQSDTTALIDAAIDRVIDEIREIRRLLQ